VARLLVVTNDFPPRTGGIQSFVGSVVARLPPEEVVVYTSAWRGADAWDTRQPFRVIRDESSVLLPTPAVSRRAARLLREHGCRRVWFGAAAPLGLLAPALRRTGAERIVATTHGHEVGWARMPAARSMLRRIAGSVDAVTFLGEFTRSRLAAALGSHSDRLVRLAPGVDTTRFRPDPDAGRSIRASLGLADRPVVVCVSRLMARKGQDVLVRSLAALRATLPDVALLLVGGGPQRDHLARLAGELDVADAVRFTGSVPFQDLPGHYCAGDVFAMPCRSRVGGLDVEGLGMVFLEASACGLPVIVGRSGGAPDTVKEGDTGWLVDPRDPLDVARRLREVLVDPARSAMGGRGRDWVAQQWSWEATMAAFDGAFAATGR
jgi:phosphatidylinositol alpha-1,6-mannosyltransferase